MQRLNVFGGPWMFETLLGLEVVDDTVFEA